MLKNVPKKQLHKKKAFLEHETFHVCLEEKDVIYTKVAPIKPAYRFNLHAGKTKGRITCKEKIYFFQTKYFKDMELVVLEAQEQEIFTPKSLAQSKINPDDILLSSIILDWQEQHV